MKPQILQLERLEAELSLLDGKKVMARVHLADGLEIIYFGTLNYQHQSETGQPQFLVLHETMPNASLRFEIQRVVSIADIQGKMPMICLGVPAEKIEKHNYED